MARGGVKIDRRTPLVAGGTGVGLVVGWALWPKSYRPNLHVGPGEQLFNAFLKIGTDGRVIVALPQLELGQGSWTSLPQLLADELGADWRTVGVEPAPYGPLYVNRLLRGQPEAESEGESRPGAFAPKIVATAGSTSTRAFGRQMREAGAGARALLMQAAARRWGGDWRSLDTVAGFVTGPGGRLAFAELAEAAARERLPDDLPVRAGIENRLTGQPAPRLDLPSKIDGSARFAADVRLPGLAYASVRNGPSPDSRLVRIDQ